MSFRYSFKLKELHGPSFWGVHSGWLVVVRGDGLKEPAGINFGLGREMVAYCGTSNRPIDSLRSTLWGTNDFLKNSGDLTIHGTDFLAQKIFITLLNNKLHDGVHQ